MGRQIERQFDAVLINRVLNHPEVFPWVSIPGLESFDMSPYAGLPDFYILAREEGGFMFAPLGDGVYEVHTQFLPKTRGVLRDAQQAAEYMFTQTDCVEIRTFVPHGNERAKKLTEAMGFTYEGVDGTWTYHDGTTVPVDYYVLTKEGYASSSDSRRLTD